MSEPIKHIVIVGGGSSGWMSAALLSKLLQGRVAITLVESEQIGTVGVGEATIPAIKLFNHLAGIAEADFIKATGATFKLGIEFVNWKTVGHSYFHAFGALGRQWEWLSFYQYWLKLQQLGQALPFEHYCIASCMAQQHKFMPADANRPQSPVSEIAYAYHFDAGLYARYLRELSEQRGVVRLQGLVSHVARDEVTGHIRHLLLDDGRQLHGDLFIDCSGSRALLLGQALGVGYDDWSHWLPNDSAWAVPTEALTDVPPYTRSTAHSAGWQWRIPLQHRTGNGLVFSSEFCSDDEARSQLLAGLTTPPLDDPRLLRFTTGKRKQMWWGNCVAIGLSSGFLEPLESTSLHLVQTAITRLVNLFPDKSFAQANIDHYNLLAATEMEQIRDFIVAHYKVTQRNDSEYWRYCRRMQVPEPLAQKLAIFSAYGRVHRVADELFREDSWVQVLLGQGLSPNRYDPLVDLKPEAQLRDFAASTAAVIQSCVAQMPKHQDFIARLMAST
ncbi:tryptophan halogenase family protein [Rheinheimera sp.]|uniref:tryptophan halogenase family protein n=1 Tax=Rheinheimera sp. TaxID=1869214 RepID=UPI00307DD3D8